MEIPVYQEMYDSEGKFWWHRGQRAIVRRVLDRYLGESSSRRLLDVGAGTGGMYQLLSRYGKVEPIDISPEAIRLAATRNISVIPGEAESLPYPDASFDVVTCFDVLCNRMVKSDQKAMSEFYRVLKPGGILVLREPAYNWMQTSHDAYVWTIRRFTRPELRRKLGLLGFKILKISHLMFFLFPIALLDRFLLEKKHKELHYPTSSKFASNPIVSFVFERILRLEGMFLSILSFPFGLSVIVIARKPNPNE